MNDRVALRNAAYTGFRLPTLNALYRPFRVSNDIIKDYSDLKPEQMCGIEGGVRLSPGGGVTASATLFHVRLKNAVDNVVIQTTAGNNAALGVFVPAGGSLAQRRGLEAEPGWQVSGDPRLAAAYLRSDSEITDPGSITALKGKQLGPSPRQSGTVDAAWIPPDPLTLRVRL